jgi:hypothetical protein
MKPKKYKFVAIWEQLCKEGFKMPRNTRRRMTKKELSQHDTAEGGAVAGYRYTKFGVPE